MCQHYQQYQPPAGAQQSYYQPPTQYNAPAQTYGQPPAHSEPAPAPTYGSGGSEQVQRQFSIPSNKVICDAI